MTAAMIVAATRELLASIHPKDITFASVARRLGVPSSSVYNYFPNRDALLIAVSADVFAGFHFEDPGEAAPWQQRVRAWLNEIDHFLEHNPVAFRVMATGDHASPAWINVRAPLLDLLIGAGFRARELAVVHAWLEGQITGLLLVEHHAGHSRATIASGYVEAALVDEAAACDAERRKHLPSIRRDEILTLGFDSMIAALEKRLGDFKRNA